MCNGLNKNSLTRKGKQFVPLSSNKFSKSISNAWEDLGFGYASEYGQIKILIIDHDSLNSQDIFAFSFDIFHCIEAE